MAVAQQNLQSAQQFFGHAKNADLKTFWDVVTVSKRPLAAI